MKTINTLRAFLLASVILTLAACATNPAEKLASGEKGMVIWAVEVEVDKPASGIGSFLLGEDTGRYYSLVPAFVARPANGEQATYNDDTIPSTVNGLAALRAFERNGNRVRWYSATVDPGPLTLAFIDESARFVSIGFARRFFTTLGTPVPGAENTHKMLLTPDTPNFLVAPGEVVYVGTFGGKIRTPEGALGNKRAQSIVKTYRMIQSDADGVAQRFGLDSEQVRFIDLFDGRKRAAGAYFERYVGSENE